MTKFESGVKVVPASQEAVYEKLSNLSNLEKVKDRLPEDKVKNLSFDAESMTIEVAPVGKITLQIVEKEPCKCIKFATTTSPLPFNLWIQIVPVTETECKMKLTIGMDINPFMKMIPGHGGILDRFDSVIFTAPVVYYLVQLMQHIG